MWLVTLKCKRTSKFDLLLESVRAYAHPGWEHRFEVADFNPQRRTIVVLVHRHQDLFYLLNDLSYDIPSEGAYDRVEWARVSHVTNDPACDCTACREGTLTREDILA